MENLLKYFPFLGSTRFQMMVATFVLYYLSEYGLAFDAQAAANVVIGVMTGSIVIRTADRHGEKAGSKDTK